MGILGLQWGYRLVTNGLEVEYTGCRLLMQEQHWHWLLTGGGSTVAQTLHLCMDLILSRVRFPEVFNMCAVFPVWPLQRVRLDVPIRFSDVWWGFVLRQSLWLNGTFPWSFLCLFPGVGCLALFRPCPCPSLVGHLAYVPLALEAWLLQSILVSSVSRMCRQQRQCMLKCHWCDTNIVA